MTEEIKLCKDCNHIESYLDAFHYCKHPKVSNERSLVHGESIKILCGVARLSHQPCGPDAKLFEPKPPKKRRWFF